MTAAIIPFRAKAAPLSPSGKHRPRDREHLTEPECERLIKAARAGRWGVRDAALLDLIYGHGLRVGEALALRWPCVDLDGGIIHIAREKGGNSGDHQLRGVEIRALRKLRREQADHATPRAADFIFCSERGTPLTPRGVQLMIDRAAERAGLAHLHPHPHSLRHACGYKLINQGTDVRIVQAYLGHKQISNTQRYTAIAPNRFRGLWRD